VRAKSVAELRGDMCVAPTDGVDSMVLMVGTPYFCKSTTPARALSARTYVVMFGWCLYKEQPARPT
jgi:hypothetical protein